MRDFNINRRLFLKGATASLALTTFAAYGTDIINPAKSIRVGLIGCGWYGKSDLFRLIQVVPVEVVALCDPDKNMLNKAGALVKERMSLSKTPLLYSDYRKMLSNHKFDIVLIGTPDHWHALTAIEAMKAGAHVYVQKPISVDVIEGEAMLAAARKYNRVVQVGLQRRSTPHWIEAKQNIIDAGLLGKISHVEMCCYYHMRLNNKLHQEPVPDFFDFDLWTGPAPLRAFDGLPHGRWRSFTEYGNGIVGDMCVHMFDAARWLLNLGWPKRITSTGGIYVQKESSSDISDTQTAVFEYDELNCVWQHRTWGTPADPEYPWALKIYGDKGTLALSTMKYDFVPDGDGNKIHKDVLYEKEKYPEDLKEERIELQAAPATRAHMLNFLKAIEDKGRPVADIEEGHISTASCILANLSMKLGRPLVYDPKTKQVVGDAEATALLKRSYRGPWEHPDPNKV
ncbi:Gfo/Idh/MocA family protein [Chryseosolibacter indicus]|uniref:Gfo/Idh/MocA family oxidoreductase n=1 Tax=Chryseosolibacter indicus TaxID=2782351 RepID=A0ABS5VQP8_9BACT|nr:Gfo/Idh/MocA family oxidoreductase [Chryseosolibacter indicus]MBT1703671.1 Gfo/Idh/MocA family oxidoreductase [Chryseosolibacter indicus]